MCALDFSNTIELTTDLIFHRVVFFLCPHSFSIYLYLCVDRLYLEAQDAYSTLALALHVCDDLFSVGLILNYIYYIYI